MDLNSFRAALTRCGVAEAAARNAIIAQGYQNMVQFAAMLDSDVEKLVKHLARLPQPVTVPFSAVKKLKAMRAWTLWQVRQGFPVVHVAFTQDVLAWATERLDAEERVRALEADTPTAPEALNKLSKWTSWWEAFDQFASQVRGTMYLPLRYVYREVEVPTAEQLAATYVNTDEELMALVRLTGEDYNTDNHHLWNLLCPLLKDGPAWVWVKHYERTKNARAAIAAIKLQAEGQAAIQARKARAYQTIRTATFTGRGKRFVYDDYVKILQRSFNELEECGEEQTESRKVDVFLRGLKAPSLASARVNIVGDDAKMASFHQAQLYVKTVLTQLEGLESETGAPHERVVAGVENGKAEARFYKKEEWDELGPERQKKIRQLRQEQGIAKTTKAAAKKKKKAEKKRKAAELAAAREEKEKSASGDDVDRNKEGRKE